MLWMYHTAPQGSDWPAQYHFIGANFWCTQSNRFINIVSWQTSESDEWDVKKKLHTVIWARNRLIYNYRRWQYQAIHISCSKYLRRCQIIVWRWLNVITAGNLSHRQFGTILTYQATLWNWKALQTETLHEMESLPFLITLVAKSFSNPLR